MSEVVNEEIITAPNGMMFRITVVATGEVHDAEGNLLNQDVELTGSVDMTKEQVDEFVERISKP